MTDVVNVCCYVLWCLRYNLSAAPPPRAMGLTGTAHAPALLTAARGTEPHCRTRSRRARAWRCRPWAMAAPAGICHIARPRKRQGAGRTKAGTGQCACPTNAQFSATHTYTYTYVYAYAYASQPYLIIAPLRSILLSLVMLGIPPLAFFVGLGHFFMVTAASARAAYSACSCLVVM